MAGLLVSVRSAAEALAALEGGAAIIDVKEPDRGALGRADPAVWAAVRAAVPSAVPVSVALGELAEGSPPAVSWTGIAYRKLGLAGAGSGWEALWASYRCAAGTGPGWIAVAYADWEQAAAPSPDAVLAAALAAGCRGILLDTWDKRRPGPVDARWNDWVARPPGRLAGCAGRRSGSSGDRAVTPAAPRSVRRPRRRLQGPRSSRRD